MSNSIIDKQIVNYIFKINIKEIIRIIYLFPVMNEYNNIMSMMYIIFILFVPTLYMLDNLTDYSMGQESCYYSTF